MKEVFKFLLLLLFFAGVAGEAHAKLQGQARLDSFEKELNSDKYKNRDDSNKVKLLNAISYYYYSIDPDKGIAYGRQQLALAEKIKWETGIGMSYDNIGVNYLYKSSYDTALDYYNRSMKIYEQTNDTSGIAGCYGNIGYLYTLKGDFGKALEYDLKALKIFEDAGNKKGAVNTLGNIGSLYMNKGDYAQALDYSFRALKINEETGNKNNIASNLGTIGSIYTQQQEYAKALDYYFRALKLNTELEKKNGIAGNHANIGSVYSFQNDYAKALEYEFKALNIYEEMGAKTGMALVLGNIGEMYGTQRNYTQAIAFNFRALKIARDAGDKNAEAGQLGKIGLNYLGIVIDPAVNNDLIVSQEFYTKPYIADSLIPRGKTAPLHKALEYETMAVAFEQEVGNLELLEQYYSCLSQIDSALGDYKGSLVAYHQYKKLNDSVYNSDTKIKITDLESKRELDLKDKQIEINKLAVAKKHNERVFFIAGIVLLLLVIVVVLRNYFSQRRSNVLLSIEKKRSEDLLLNILPDEVAEELKAKGTAAAKLYDNVTVLFTDFVNFTYAGERMTPQELIDELHTCFKEFDGITGKYNIEKIKTIGDAYLAVGGLPKSDPLHAENIVRAAIEINAFMNKRIAELGEKTFEIRIGIHSGSVVAGIVGVKKFAYDIWGDTVNTAARMEQNSASGKINISETTYELVKDKFACEYRGEIDAKNKGMLKMYFVR